LIIITAAPENFEQPRTQSPDHVRRSRIEGSCESPARHLRR
jgi:hypothetical protein